MTELTLSSFGFFLIPASSGGVGSFKDLVSSKSRELMDIEGILLSDIEMKDLRVSVAMQELELEFIGIEIEGLIIGFGDSTVLFLAEIYFFTC